MRDQIKIGVNIRALILFSYMINMEMVVDNTPKDGII